MDSPLTTIVEHQAAFVTRRIVCGNPLCKEVVRTGRPQELGTVVGVEAHIPCPRCRRVTSWRAAKQ